MILGSCLAAVVAASACLASTAKAAGETRTLHLYFTHTKENLSVTYKKNGRYVPGALKKINWFLRDWRRNEATTMSKETLDLLWELHADLGSKKPIHIISAYRSPRTNAMLRRIGRKVARKSQHMRGRAIDFYFPDVPTERVMGSAFLRQIGGVGYYPRSGKHGFVHIDDGNVRHWPRMSAQRIAGLRRKYSRTINARLGRPQTTQIAAVQKPAPAPAQPSGPVSLLSDSFATAGSSGNTGKPNLAQAVLAGLPGNTESAPAFAPRPRPKPIEVLMLAAAAMKIEPTAAPVPRSNFTDAEPESPVRGSLGPVTIASLAHEDRQSLILSNSSAKGSFNNTDAASGKGEPSELRPLSITYANTSSLTDLFSDAEANARRNGAPQPFVKDEELAVHTLSQEDKSALARMIEAFMPGSDGAEAQRYGVNSSAKGDRQVVNRGGKGNFSPELVGTTGIWQQSDASGGQVLLTVEQPLAFRLDD